MNININCTIIFQTIHFLIAYLLIRWAFNPLWLAIKVRRDQQDYLHRSIVGIDHDIDRARKNHLSIWQQFSEHINKRIQTLFYDKAYPISNTFAEENIQKNISEKSIDLALVEEIAHALVLKIEDKHGPL